MLKSSATIPLLFLLTLTQTAFADTISLKNGDRLSGQITKMHKNELVIKTSYSEVTIPWADIKAVDSNHPITVQLTDDSQLKGTLVQTAQGPSIQNPHLNTPIPLSMDNIKAINPPVISDNAIVTGGVNIGGSKTSGNTDTQSFHADASIVARAGNNKFSAGAEYNQAANNSQESENNFHIFTKYDHYFAPQWYASLFTNFTKDRFQDLNFRSAFGAGLGHEFWNDETSFLSGEIGAAYTIEDYDQGLDREFIAGRWAANYHYWIFEERLQFFHNHEGLVSLEDVSDLLVRSRTGFKIPVYNGFNLLAQFDWDYDTKPADGKDNTDVRYIIGAGYSW